VRVAGLARRHAEHSVVLGQQFVVEQGIGLDDGLDLGQTHLLDQPVLGSPEGAFHPPLGLRAERPDQLDVQLAQGAAELRYRLVQGLALVLRLEDAVPVGIQRQGAAVPLQPAQQQVEVVDHRVGVVEATQ